MGGGLVESELGVGGEWVRSGRKEGGECLVNL